jgi:WD40 repeat protein
MTDFRRVRFSASGQFLAASNGKTGDNQEGYEVWHLPTKVHPLHRRSDVVLRDVEWDAVRDELYVPHYSVVDVVTPTGEVLQTLSGSAGEIPGRQAAGFARANMLSAGDRLLLHSPFLLVGWRRAGGRWVADWHFENSTGSSVRFTSTTLYPDSRRLVSLVNREHRVPHITFSHLFVERDLTNGQPLAQRPLSEKEAPVGVRTRLSVLPDGSAVVGFRGRSVYAWPADPAKPARRGTVAKKDVWDVALHPSGRWLVAVCDSPEVSVWDLTAWKPVRTYDWGIGRLWCAACSPDGFMAAVGSVTGKVTVWDWDL